MLAVSTDHLAGSLSALFIFDLGSSMYKEVIFVYPRQLPLPDGRGLNVN
jgi:hypothetical protein